MRLLVPSNQKLVPFLQDVLSEVYSGKVVRKILDANLCRINGRIERFGSASVKRGDIVELSPAWKTILSRPSGKAAFNTLYEDADLLLVDKPSGWVCNEENCRRTFGSHFHLVHRLDKDTTGVLALAKNPKVRDELMELFAKREVVKEYLAIVDGHTKEEGMKESFLAKKRAYEGQTIWGSAPRGLQAFTSWKRLALGRDSSLLLCSPLTGRTHQIRVHLAESGHPILIDRQYAAHFRCTVFAERPLLHAYRLRIRDLEVKAPLPLDIREGIASLNIKFCNSL